MTITLTQTTLAAAVDSVSNTIRLASCTNVPNPGGGGDNQTILMVNNEAMTVTAVSPDVPATPSGAGQVSVVRGTNGTRAKAHVSGSEVLLGRPNQFYTTDPSGAVASTDVDVTPRINVPTSNQWVAPVDRWIPGMGNPGNSGTPVPSGASAAVASAAGLVTPSGPFFHITGVLAITGFNIPEGFNGGSFTVIPDGIFTWTNATNIAVAGTSVVGKALTFTYDPATNKFYPSYIA
jgi:hypothetical protein